jgi:hypothetical protein
VRQTNDNTDNYRSVAASYRYCGLLRTPIRFAAEFGGHHHLVQQLRSSAGGYTSAQQRADYPNTPMPSSPSAPISRAGWKTSPTNCA